MINKIYAKDKINNVMASSLHRYGHCYDSLETDIYVDIKIEKNKELLLLLNNKMLDFISDINIEFFNDFDEKINFNKLPRELNNLINLNLIDEKSININLYNIDSLYNLDYKLNKINKNLINCNLLFKLKDKYLNNLKKYENISDFSDKLPNYLLNRDDYGIILNSTVNRNLRIIITYMNFNNESFYGYKDKFIDSVLI